MSLPAPATHPNMPPSKGETPPCDTLRTPSLRRRRPRKSLLMPLRIETAKHECVSEDALQHLKSYKYSSVDKSFISRYILKHYVCTRSSAERAASDTADGDSGMASWSYCPCGLRPTSSHY